MLPLFAAIDALFKISHALFDITLEHVVLVDPGSASLDDLVADLREKTLHPLSCVVIFTELPNDSDAVKNLGKDLWDIFWLGKLYLSAWFRKGVEELQVVLRFVMTGLDLLLQFKETWEVGTWSMLKNLNDFLKLWLLESLSQDDKIGSSLIPVGDLIQWTLNLVVSWRILVGHELFDLTGPVNDSGLQSLEQILVFGSGLDVAEVLIWDV